MRSLFQRAAPGWSPEASEGLYGLSDWGAPYFAVNARGRVAVSPRPDRAAIDLYELVASLHQRGLEPPLLLRFPDIVADRLERLCASFERAIARYRYGGSYRSVYPSKCNPQRALVEAVVAAGRSRAFGLEAGSKPELLVALASLAPLGARHPLLICNGTKDRDYLETALLASRSGINTVIVIEQLDELDRALACARELDIRPTLGLRAKLSAPGGGRWGKSTGDRAKFGLDPLELVAAAERLAAVGKLDCLQLLHFHGGSQIADIAEIKAAIREGARLYVELARLGAAMGYLDVGGGLAVDYDGSRAVSGASRNYTLQNYANDIVAETGDACRAADLAPPVLVSESGRAIAAHHAVLVGNVLGCRRPPTGPPPPPRPDEPPTLRHLRETYAQIAPDTLQESWHDALQFREEAASRFNLGYFSLRDRARADRLYWACCRKLAECARGLPAVPSEIAGLESVLAAVYRVNFSVFRSLPDAWALQQLFPVMPLHRLECEPRERGILADLTCDSDGQLAQFPSPSGTPSPTLALHALDAEPYYLGVFLVGAYQEILGNAHNLFGTLSAVSVRTQPDGYRVEPLGAGETVADAIARAGYETEALLARLRAAAARHLDAAATERFADACTRSLRGSTYVRAESAGRAASLQSPPEVPS